MNRFKISLLSLLVLWSLPTAGHAEKYALLIGIDKYPDRAYNLESCIADIHGVAEALQKNCGYRAQNIQILVGEGKTKVTRKEILDTVAQMGTRIQPDDTILFFWSGHGSYLEGSDRVLPYDIEYDTKEAYERTSLPVQEMIAPLQRTRSRALLLFFNMCRSDADTKMGYLASPAVAAAAPKIEKPGVGGPQQKVAVYSSPEGQWSWMWPTKHRSFFGYFLEQGLRGAAADAQGEIHAENLIGYIKHAVTGRCWRESVFPQQPYAVTSGPEALHLSLASGLPPGKGGTTAVPMVVGESVIDRFDALFQAATEQWMQQRYEEACVKFEEAVKLKPDETQGVVALADAYKQLRRFDEADSNYRKAIKAWPDNGNLVTGLADICWYRKNYDEAEKLYREAMVISPTASSPVFALASLLANIRNDPGKRFPLYLHAIQLDPTDPAIQTALGRAYVRLQKLDEAEKVYRKMMEVHPENGAAVEGVGYIVYTVKKDVPEAIKLYRKAAELDPRSISIQITLGQIYAYDDKSELLAEQCFRKAMELEPENIEPILELAKLRYNHKNYPTAESLYRQAITLNAADGDIHAHLAACLWMEKKQDAAREEAKKAVDLGSKDMWAHEVLGLKIAP